MNKCNVCGKSLELWDVYSGVEIHKTLGYGSRYDGEPVSLKICCNCFDKILDGCRIVPFDRKDDAN